jgi:hypothetical protein
MRKLRAILSFIRHQAWVNEPVWNSEDEKSVDWIPHNPHRLKAICYLT